MGTYWLCIPWLLSSKCNECFLWECPPAGGRCLGRSLRLDLVIHVIRLIDIINKLVEEVTEENAELLVSKSLLRSFRDSGCVILGWHQMSELHLNYMLWKKECFVPCLYGGCRSHPVADVTGALDLFPRMKPEGLNCHWWVVSGGVNRQH